LFWLDDVKANYNRIMNRRTVLTLGLVGGPLLALGAGASTLLGRNTDQDTKAVLGALIPAVLAGIPQAANQLDEAIKAVRVAIAGLPLTTQAEISQLFSLMAAPPTRYLLTGLSKPWDQVSPQQAHEVLQSLRTHQLALLQSAYHAFHDLILGAWYGNEANWKALQYEAPTPFVSANL
jgi:hypothetical protein